MLTQTYRDLLKQSFARKCASNRRYSLRAFAQSLQLNPGHLSRVLSGKQNLSPGTARLVAEKIYRTEKERGLFVALVEFSVARNDRSREMALQQVRKHHARSSHLNLDLDRFEVISDWYPLVILETLALKDFKPSAHWISKKLGISITETEVAIDRLKRLELIKVEGDKWTRAAEVVTTPTDVANSAIRKFHRQMIDRAKGALETQKIDDRYIASMTFSISQEDRSKYKKALEDCFDRISEIANSNPNKDGIYQMNVQFFDLLSGGNEK